MAIKLRLLTKIPALFNGDAGVSVTRVGRVYTAVLDYLSVAAVDSIADISTRYLLVASGTGLEDQLYERIAIDDLFATSSNVVQEITAGGAQDINANASIVQVNQTVGAAITLTLPASTSKLGPVKVGDWKGDAGTNNITIALSGSDTFQGGLTTMKISGDGGSLVFSPISGVGYMV